MAKSKNFFQKWFIGVCKVESVKETSNGGLLVKYKDCLDVTHFNFTQKADIDFFKANVGEDVCIELCYISGDSNRLYIRKEKEKG